VTVDSVAKWAERMSANSLALSSERETN